MPIFCAGEFGLGRVKRRFPRPFPCRTTVRFRAFRGKTLCVSAPLRTQSPTKASATPRDLHEPLRSLPQKHTYALLSFALFFAVQHDPSLLANTGETEAIGAGRGASCRREGIIRPAPIRIVPEVAAACGQVAGGGGRTTGGLAQCKVKAPLG